jgi:uncharacterized protein with NRDE domain
MCLLFLSYRTTPGYRLVVAANRDEFLRRPTAPLAFLDAEKTILAGRDLQGGGTWLGITAQLQFAAITNYRQPGVNRENAPSRGEILMDYLSGQQDAEQYMHALAENGAHYNGFNLLLGDSRELYYYSNRSNGLQLLTPGFYGLSNHLLDTPWPKVVRGKALLYRDMVESKQFDPMLLFRPLADSLRPADDQLPDTKIGLEWERLLSTICIDGVDYGTRSSAVITVSDDGQIEFIEKTMHRSPMQGITSKFVRHITQAQGIVRE